MSKEKKKKLTLKNFKGTPRKFNDNSTKTQGKVVVERKNSNFRSQDKKQTFERSHFQNLLLQKITPPSDEKKKMPKSGLKKDTRRIA